MNTLASISQDARRLFRTAPPAESPAPTPQMFMMERRGVDAETAMLRARILQAGSLPRPLVDVMLGR